MRPDLRLPVLIEDEWKHGYSLNGMKIYFRCCQTVLKSFEPDRNVHVGSLDHRDGFQSYISASFYSLLSICLKCTFLCFTFMFSVQYCLGMIRQYFIRCN